jgi:hypothetical protein
MLYPWRYELVAISPIHEQGDRLPEVVSIPPDVATVEMTRDFVLRAVRFVDLVGRVIITQPSQLPEARVQATFCLVNHQGQTTFATTRDVQVDAFGLFRIRATSPVVRIRAAHREYLASTLTVEVPLASYAGKEYSVGEIRLAGRAASVTVVARSRDGRALSNLSVEVQEMDAGQDLGGALSVIPLKADADGRFSFLIDPSKEYRFKAKGYRVSALSGAIKTRGGLGIVTFPENGGDVELTFDARP